MLNSNREGVPRVLIESLYLNTKVIISNQLKFGLKKFLNWFKNVNEDDNYNDKKYSFLFKKDKLDLILEIKFFFNRLQKFLFRKININ